MVQALGVDGGFCIRPTASDLEFCRSVNYKVYVMTETPSAEYWRDLDRKAEIMQSDWNRLDDCGVENAPQGWCQNYACALTFPKCNVFDDAPLGVCRQTCKDCFDTCQPDRPILAPSMFWGSEAATWEQAYTRVEYDAYSKAYRCDADHRLVDGVTVGLLFYGDECTSGAARAPPLLFLTGLWSLAVASWVLGRSLDR